MQTVCVYMPYGLLSSAAYSLWKQIRLLSNASTGPAPILGASADSVAKLHTFDVNNEPDEAGPICAICVRSYEIGETCATLPCFHIFHAQCIREWLLKQATCPICRRSIDSSRSS
ncbi:hypothetical protein D915_000756 [Fasciola hepatica]|uniref:Uncharacterized protein n=1 Tax=Fasciola hepatica TaxID=6192 RepID=A0A2H1CWV4_FASHE|nr:hypothetical protein D915_000756 [Fasciola hepatica]